MPGQRLPMRKLRDAEAACRRHVQTPDRGQPISRSLPGKPGAREGELSGSSATGGATVSGARRKDARPSALSVSPIIRVEIAGRDRIARAQRAIGEIDRPLGQEMLAKAMMKFHELAEHYASLAAGAADPEDREANAAAEMPRGTGGYAKGRSFNRKSVTEMAISRNSTMHSARPSLPSGRLSSPIAREIMFSRSIVALFFVPSGALPWPSDMRNGLLIPDNL